MLEQIIDLIKNQASDHFVNATDVPNEHAEKAANIAGLSIFQGLAEQIMQGNGSAISQLLNNSGNAAANASGLMNNPIVQNIISQFTGNMQQHAGVNQATAQQAAGIMPNLIQQVIGKFASRAPQDSGFDVTKLLSLVTSGGGNNLQNSGVGSILNIAQSLLGNNNNANTSNNNNSGLSNLINNFLGN